MPADRTSLNRAFWDLGLRFHWDEGIWASLVGLPDLRSQLAWYLQRYQPHILAVYDVDFLSRIIEERLRSPVDARLGIEAHRS